jgi:hypothetical protein
VRRRYRIALAIVFVASAAAAVIGLSALGNASEGPLSAALGWLGAAAGGVEHRVRDRLGGTPRRATLEWLEPYRSSAARLRSPDIVLLGAYDSGIPQTLDGVLALEQTIAAPLPLIQVYSAWGDKADEQFPVELLAAVSGLGSIPVVTWEPWLTDFESVRHPAISLRDARDRHGMAAVAKGDYDFYIDAWAAEAARFAKPFLLRFAHEMNDPYRYPWGPQNNTKEEYIAAWRHVVDRFRRAGATNVVWVWSPHVAYEYWDLYYPGPEYVDWVATGVLNFGPIAQWSRWWTFAEIFGQKYRRLASFGKPIMIAELGSLAVGGDRNAWYEDAIESIARDYPAVRAALFFHARDDQTVTYQKVDWTIASDSSLSAAVRRSLASSGLACPRPTACRR